MLIYLLLKLVDQQFADGTLAYRILIMRTWVFFEYTILSTDSLKLYLRADWSLSNINFLHFNWAVDAAGSCVRLWIGSLDSIGDLFSMRPYLPENIRYSTTINIHNMYLNSRQF